MPTSAQIFTAERSEERSVLAREAAAVLLVDVCHTDADSAGPEVLKKLVERFGGVWTRLGQLARGERATDGSLTEQQQRLVEFCEVRVRTTVALLHRAISIGDFDGSHAFSSRVHTWANRRFRADAGKRRLWWHGGLSKEGSGFPLRVDAELQVRAAMIELDTAARNATQHEPQSPRMIGKGAKGMLSRPLVLIAALEKYAAGRQLSDADKLRVQQLIDSAQPDADKLFAYAGQPPLPPEEWETAPCALDALTLPLDEPVRGISSEGLDRTGSVELRCWDELTGKPQDRQELVDAGDAIETMLLAAHASPKGKLGPSGGGTVRNRGQGSSGDCNLSCYMLWPRGQHPPDTRKVTLRAEIGSMVPALGPLMRFLTILDFRWGCFQAEILMYRRFEVEDLVVGAHRDLLRLLYYGFQPRFTAKAGMPRQRFAILLTPCVVLVLTARTSVLPDDIAVPVEAQMLMAGGLLRERWVAAGEECEGGADFCFFAGAAPSSAVEIDDEGGSGDEVPKGDPLADVVCEWEWPDGYGENRARDGATGIRRVARIRRAVLTGASINIQWIGRRSPLLHGSSGPSKAAVMRAAAWQQRLGGSSSVAAAAAVEAAAEPQAATSHEVPRRTLRSAPQAAVSEQVPRLTRRSGSRAPAASPIGAAAAAEPACEPDAPEPSQTRSGASAASAASAAVALQAMNAAAAQPDAAASPPIDTAASQAIALEALLGMPTAAAASGVSEMEPALQVITTRRGRLPSMPSALPLADAPSGSKRRRGS